VSVNGPVEQIHEITRIPATQDGTADRLVLSDQPAAFKRYPGAARRTLPAGLLSSNTSAVDVLSGVKAGAGGCGEDTLASILFLAAGVTRGRRSAAGAPVWFRTSMSAGNLHPIEIYVVAGGVWHYDPWRHGLDCVREYAGQPHAYDSATVILTAVPYRSCWKYAERGFRHIYWDAGTLLSNLLAAADAYGVEAQIELGFDDDEVAGLIGVDGVDEVPLAVVRVGSGGNCRQGPVGSANEGSPVVRDGQRIRLVVQAHAEGNLAEADVDSWRVAIRSTARRAWPAVAPLADPPHPIRLEDVVLRRGSPRRFAPDGMTRAEVEWSLSAATRSTPIDVSPGGTLIEHLVHIHSVDGLAPGCYRVTAEGELERRDDHGDVRRCSRELCLDQAHAGDSAFTVFHVGDLKTVLSAAGGQVATSGNAPAGSGAELEVRGLTLERVGEVAFTAGVPLYLLAPVRASLEEAFMELTAGSVEYQAAMPEPRQRRFATTTEA